MSKSDVKVTIDKKAKTMTITIPLVSPPRLSSTGKNMLLATTGGNQRVDCEWEGKQVTVGCNAYIPPN